MSASGGVVRIGINYVGEVIHTEVTTCWWDAQRGERMRFLGGTVIDEVLMYSKLVKRVLRI